MRKVGLTLITARVMWSRRYQVKDVRSAKRLVCWFSGVVARARRLAHRRPKSTDRTTEPLNPALLLRLMALTFCAGLIAEVRVSVQRGKQMMIPKLAGSDLGSLLLAGRHTAVTLGRASVGDHDHTTTEFQRGGTVNASVTESRETFTQPPTPLGFFLLVDDTPRREQQVAIENDSASTCFAVLPRALTRAAGSRP